MEVKTRDNKVIFDPIYGFIAITSLEWEIIHSPFYQRLRWIKQLGFSCYTFPGAEHSRFGHSIGVMFNAHRIMQSIGKAVSDEMLFDDKCLTPECLFHKQVRLAALLHDIGTFPFSHTTEGAYIDFGETTNNKAGKGLPDDHEHLGSYIIKNTDYEGGLTSLLHKYGLSSQKISDLVKGVDESVLANQILHSDVDCDRMDYLLRDALYTGLKYGAYDRDYLLHHFQVAKVGDQEVLAIKHNALHCVEDFLQARFAWYSQVIRSPRGAKFDALAEHLTFFMLEKGWIYRYGQLLEMVQKGPELFYAFNDNYFMSTVHKLYIEGKFDKFPKMKQIAFALLFEKGPRSIRCEEFKQRILNQDDEASTDKTLKKAKDKVDEIQHLLATKGRESDWIVSDLPKKRVLFVKSHRSVVKATKSPNILLERDPVKIVMENGDIRLLAEVENSIICHLQNAFNFIPNVFCTESTLELLKNEKIIPE